MSRAQNREVTVFASAAYTASQNSADLVNPFARGAVITINCTAIVTAPSVVFTVVGRVSLAGVYYTILASAAITAAGTTNLRIYPGLTAAANVTVSDILPGLWRVQAVHANGNSISYSVAANYIL
jgi:hypothetical protein